MSYKVKNVYFALKSMKTNPPIFFIPGFIGFLFPDFIGIYIPQIFIGYLVCVRCYSMYKAGRLYLYKAYILAGIVSAKYQILNTKYFCERTNTKY